MGSGSTATPARPQVLIFRNELLPLSETFIRAQAEALKRFEPTFVGVHPALRSMELPSSPWFVAAKHTLVGKLRRRLFWRTGYVSGFARTFPHQRPALIHAHFAVDGAAALPLQARLRCPLVVTLHGYDVTFSDAALRRSPEGRTYLRSREALWDRASVFLCVSEFIRKQALLRGFPAHKLRVFYTGIDLSRFSPGTRERDPDLVLFVGRLVDKKGGRPLLEALHLVSQQRPQTRLVVIGAGPRNDDWKTLSQNLNVHCTFMGSQSPEVVSNYVREARLFCVPSITAANGDSEGLGMVFAEAQAAGTPVVSFRHGGIPEVVEHGRTGLLAGEGNVAELKQHLLRLLSDDDLWSQFSNAGIAHMRERFDLTTRTDALEDLYEEVLLHSSH